MKVCHASKFNGTPIHDGFHRSHLFNYGPLNMYVGSCMGIEGGEVLYNREVLVNVLTYHWRTNTSGCGGCDVMKLGESHPEHIADVYEQRMR